MAKTTCDCNVIHEELVKAAIASRPEAREIAALSTLFKVIGDETRVQILWLLNTSEMCVCDISNVLNMTKSAVSHQLSTLSKHGLVRSRRAGKEVLYRLDDEHITALYELGIEHVRHKAASTAAPQEIKDAKEPRL